MIIDQELKWIFAGIFGVLLIATVAGRMIRYRHKGEGFNLTIENLNTRINAWWGMCLIVTLAVFSGWICTVILFAMISFFALREFITLIPTHRADHRALFWTFFILMPAQYYCVATGWYGLFTILIPVYAFLFLPTRMAVAGDSDYFLARAARIQWALMICVYCVSHAPAIVMIKIKGFEGEGIKLLLFLLIVVQLSDVLQYVCGKLFGKHKIAPKVSPNKTVEGFVGGVILSAGVGAGLFWMTPFTPWIAFGMGLIINLMGFAGGLCMSSIKRDRGVKDFGNIIRGHGGVLDRIDSLCFAAPIFFHAVRYFYT